MGSQIVGLCFDSRVEDSVVGLDLLQQLYFAQKSAQPFLYLFSTQQDMTKFEKNIVIKRKPLIQYETQMGIIAINDAHFEFPLSYIKKDIRTGEKYVEVYNIRCVLI